MLEVLANLGQASLVCQYRLGARQQFAEVLLVGSIGSMPICARI
ncbi:hypothetical protein [Nocardia miyunensis]|nr:hypothetical protein [Nocardia miyunensis]